MATPSVDAMDTGDYVQDDINVDAIVKETIRDALKIFEADPASLEQKGWYCYCDHCHRNLSSALRIRCTECADFDLCVECFSVGVQIRGHKSNHGYQIQEPLDFAVLSQDWTADEELFLLEGVETLGFGNWEGIAEHVGSKSKQKCRKHYMQYYVDSPAFPKPDLSRPPPPPRTEPLVVSEGTPLLAVALSLCSLYEPDIDTKPVKMESKVLPQNPTPLELAGYMAKRGDFATEFENEAEQIIADLTFGPDDTQEDRLLKLRILDIYNSKLDQRARRKKFVKERGLLDIKKLQQKERKLNKSDRELLARLRPFARHQSASESDALINGLLEEQALRRRIMQLRAWRDAGIRSVAQGTQFENDKRKREQDLRTGKQRPLAASLSAAAAAVAPGIARSSTRGPKPVGRPPSAAAAAGATPMPDTPSTPQTPLLADKRPLAAAQQGNGGTPVLPARRVNPLDVSAMSAIELLGEAERQVCSAVRLTPQQYLHIKDLLVAESYRLGYLKRATARSLLKIDVNKTGRLYDFFVASGWINPDPAVKFPAIPPPPPPPQPQPQPAGAAAAPAAAVTAGAAPGGSTATTMQSATGADTAATAVVPSTASTAPATGTAPTSAPSTATTATAATAPMDGVTATGPSLTSTAAPSAHPAADHMEGVVSTTVHVKTEPST